MAEIALSQLGQELSAAIAVSKRRFVRGEWKELRKDEDLPEPLQGYKPARYWADSTIETWLHIRNAPPGLVILTPERWLKLFEDMLRTTGVTNWCDPVNDKDFSVFFAGRRVSPDFEAMQPKPQAIE